jgi:guanine nucleotide-binding protein G(i) subunit alpha
MGACVSAPSEEYKQSADRSKKLEQMNKKTWNAEQQKIKLLLLGAGESGKSTIFKQMKIIYGNPFPTEERAQLVTVVHSNIVSNGRLLASACEKIVPLADPAIAADLAAVPDAEDTPLDRKVADILKRLWADPGAQQTWARRAEYHIQDAFSWYMNELDRISLPGYIPSVDDILRARVRTSGIVEESYKIDGVEFVMYDVGGQRNERKKWIHCFDAVTAVIFVVAISEYDQFLYEDDQMYRMDEAVLLFDEMCNLRHFKNTSMILFLNKNDLFREKLKTIPVCVNSGPKKRYESFQGPYVKFGTADAEFGNPDFEAAYEAAKEFFLQLFLRRNQQINKEIYHHVTCATDTSNIKVVFNAAKDIILKDNLRGSGFMD